MAAQGRDAERQDTARAEFGALHPGEVVGLYTKMSWVTLDRICEEEMLSDKTIRRLIEGSNRPLRSDAAS